MRPEDPLLDVPVSAHVDPLESGEPEVARLRGEDRRELEVTVGDVEEQRASRLQSVEVELERLACEQVERDGPRRERIQDDEVVAAGRSGELESAVTRAKIKGCVKREATYLSADS